MTCFDQWVISKCNIRHIELKSTCGLVLAGLLSGQHHLDVNEPSSSLKNYKTTSQLTSQQLTQKPTAGTSRTTVKIT